MPKRYYTEYVDDVSGTRFRFAHEAGQDGPLHITVRHGTTPEDAVRTFLRGMTVLNPTYKRFETQTENHVLYWVWHASGAVLVITCFQKGEA